MSTTPVIKKSLAATAVAAATLGGVAAGATLFVPGQAGAQDDATQDGAETPDVQPGERITDALQPLVDDGTITESQRDAVVETLVEARGESEGRRGNRAPRGFGGAEEIATALGLEGSEIRDALAGGDSLADLAAAQGVDSADLVDVIVANAEERINAAVEAGRIDDAEAAERLASVEEHAEDVVNGEVEFGRRGHGGPHGGPNGDQPAPGDTDTAA